MSRSVLSATALNKGGVPAVLGTLASSQTREMRWRPGLSAPSHSEIFASSSEAVGAALAFALARDGLRATERGPLAEGEDRRMVLWVQDRTAAERSGRPYLHGLQHELRHRLIHVEARTPEDALFAMEEGLRCRELAFVVGEIAGNPRALDFTASRRLSLAAEKYGVSLWLVRLDARPDLSSARMRWNAASAVSPPARWNAEAPGIPSWRAELFRARRHAPGEWTLRDDGKCLTVAGRPANEGRSAAPHYGGLVRSTVGRSMAAL